MKFLSICLLAFCLNVSAEGHSQTVNLKEKAISYSQLFRMINKQTGYQIFYRADVLDSKEKLDVTAVNSSIDHVLNEVLKNKPVQYSVFNKSIVIKPIPEQTLAFENARYLSIPESAFEVVRGVVTDQNGAPLSDVSVSVSGTSRGTVSNNDGSFSIDVKPGESLVFSRIGYETVTVTPDFKSALNIKMVQVEDIGDEVIVVGYGTQKKTNITGAVSTVGGERLENRPITNVATGLQGVSPGLIITRNNGEPGREGIGIQLRGVTSANGDVSPLVVVDGISTSIDALTRLNPNDIESISVLKDAASAAIYGSQSSGGVIVITTKNGTSGKPKLNATSIFSWKKPINMPERMSLIDEALFVRLAHFNATGNRNAEYDSIDLENIRNGVPFARPRNPNTNSFVYYNQTPPEDILLYDYAPSQNYDISLSGGTDKLNYFFSGSLLNEQGMLKIGRDESKRYNGRLKVNAKLTKHISIETGVAYLNKYYDAPESSAALGGDYSTVYKITRLRQRNPLYTPNGNYKDELIADLTEGGFQTFSENRFDANAALSIKNLLKGLTLKAVVGAQYRRDDDRAFRRNVQLYNTDTNMVDVPNTIVNNPNSYSEATSTIKRSNIQYLASYNTSFGGRHDIDAIAGYEFQDYELKGFSASASNLFNNDIPALIHSEQINRNNGQSFGAFAFQSGFGRLNYSYARRYTVEGTFRYDQSSKLAPGFQSQSFGAVSGAWNMHNENWFNFAGNTIDQLKLRASWGRLGGALGDGFANFSWANTLNLGSGLILGGSNSPYYFQASIPSAVITWENIEMTNYGIDLALFKNKLTFTGEYFIKWNKNMAASVPVPEVLGVNPPRKNIGKLKVWGWETELAYRTRIGNDFNMNVGFNLSDNQNELVEFGNRQSVSAGRVQFLTGYPLNTFWGYQTNGYYANQTEADQAPSLTGNNKIIGPGDVRYIDLTGDGAISVGEGTIENHGDLVYIGTDAPRYSFGLNLGAEYKGFDFQLFLQGVGKRNFMPTYLYLSPLGESWRMPMKIHGDYWTPENQNALFPRPFYQATHNYVPSDKWIFNAAYMRVKNLQIGYTLPQRFTQKFACNRMRVFFTSQDLLTFTKMKGFETVYDPEARNGVINDYPYFATASFGINVTF